MKDEINEILEWLSDKDIYLEDNGYLYKRISLGETNLLLDYITNLQDENNHLKQNKERTLEYIENNRIREKCIVDVNTLEGLLNE